METYLIVGGGLAGLISANLLRDRELAYVGLEKSDRLGGRAEIGPHRVYSQNSVRFLTSHIFGLEWELVEEVAHERCKGEWVEPKEVFSEEEAFYLSAPFYRSSTDFVCAVAERARAAFRMRKTVLQILPEKKVVCNDGSHFYYEKLIWCSPLDTLLRVWQGEKVDLSRALKNMKEGIGGVNLDMELNADLFPFRNTLILPFRYKDNRLRALGTCSSPRLVHWMLFLDGEIVDDKEELAKCIRTFKRELQKEFPELKTAIQSERIVYFPVISGEKPAVVRSLEVLPDIFYIGPQAGLPDADESLRNIDLMVDNCRRFEKLLAGV